MTPPAPGPPLRRGSPVVPVLLALVALTGCAQGLPTRGDVRTVRPVAADEQRYDAQLRRIPAAPQPGQSPEEVVQGFLAAGAELDVAQLFLAPGATWQSDQDAVVFDAAPKVAVVQTPPGADRAEATANLEPVLFLAPDGASRPATAADRAVSLSLGLRRESSTGQWRITSAPPVLPLRARDLPQARRRGTLAWVSPDGKRLLRDSVLLPAAGRDELLADALSRLLAGPGPRLRAAGVGSALPVGTRPLQLRQGTATEVVVDLDDAARRLRPEDVALARAQVAATLLSVQGVARVRILVEGQPLRPPGVNDAGVVTAADVAAVEAAGSGPGTQEPYVVGADAHVLPLRPEAAAAPLTAVAGLAISGGGRTTATLRRSPDGRSTPQVAATAAGTPVALAGPGGWSSVSWSPDGALWLVRDGRVLLRRAQASPQPVQVRERPAPLTTAARPGSAPAPPLLRSLVVARDGVHAVGVTQGRQLVVGLLSSTDSLLTDLHAVAPRLRGVTVAAVDSAAGESAVAAGTAPGHGGAPAAVHRVALVAPDPGSELDGDLALLPAPCPGAVVPESLGATDGQPLLAGCPDGRVKRLVTGSWSDAGGGRFPAWSG